MSIFHAVIAAAVMAAAVPVIAAGPERDLGASVRADIYSQVINHDPDYSNRPDPGSSGQRAADAMIRYQTGKLKPLLKINGKTDLGAQGGAGDTSTVSVPLISSGSPN